MMTFHRLPRFVMVAVAVAAALVSGATSSLAQDKLKIAAGQRGNWDSAVPELMQRLGIAKKHGLDLDIVWTQGAGETQQAVISNSVDIGVAPGVMGVLRAFSQGAPIRVIGNQAAGAQDLYWYVKADSPIKSWADTEGKTLAYSTNGSSTHGVVTAFMSEKKLKARLVATGGPPATLTQVMSGQIDIGWAAPPFGLDQLDKKEIRVIGKGSDTAFGGQTVRFNIVNTQTLAAKKDQITRFARGYREAVAAMYGEEALKVYADWLQIDLAKARRTRDDFFPRDSIELDKIIGLDVIVKEAVNLKYTAQPMTQSQLEELIQIPK
jgi:NitT/TauT family transport system substrate-binding protein